MRTFFCTLAVFGAFLIFTPWAGAQSVYGEYSAESDISAEISDIAQNVLGGESLAGGAFSGEDITVTGERLLEYFTVSNISRELTDILELALPDALKLLCTLFATVALSAVSGALAGGLGGGDMSGGIRFLFSAAVSATFISAQSSCISGVLEFFDNVAVLMNGMIPVTGAVWAMGGNVGSAGLGTVTLYGMLDATRLLCTEAVVPLCAVMTVCAVCASLSDGGVLEGFASAVKKIYVFFVGAVMTVFVFVLGAQTTVAGAADTVAARSGKLFVSTLIPVVGGAVGDTLRVVAGSAEYVKSVVGAGGVILLAAITLPTFISLLLSRLAILVSGTAAQMLGCGREAKLLAELGSVYGFLMGAVAVCSTAFAIAFGIFVSCTVAVA